MRKKVERVRWKRKKEIGNMERDSELERWGWRKRKRGIVKGR